MKQIKITTFFKPKKTEKASQTSQPHFSAYIEKYPFFLTTPNPYDLAGFGIVQNALTGKFYISECDQLPEEFWMRVTKDKLMDMVNAVKNMKCMNEKGETHPFLKQPEAEKEMQPFWQNENVRVEMLDISSMESSTLTEETTTTPTWFSPVYTSTPRDSPVSIINSSPALLAEPYLADYLNEDESFF
uniref:Uncharacterized protein n=4 Tax=Meloidogyne TaxID=189290 RepID=A0A6V7VP78_MELEN|nr:unnamed protein product [Meloidogyne enterolobii]